LAVFLSEINELDGLGFLLGSTQNYLDLLQFQVLGLGKSLGLWELGWGL